MREILFCLLLLSLSCREPSPNPAGRAVAPEPPEIAPIHASPAPAEESFRLANTALPPQFSLHAPWCSVPGASVDVEVHTRIGGEMELRMYRVETPVILLNSIESLEASSIPAEMRTALAAARGQTADYRPESEAGPALGDFSLVDRMNRSMPAGTGEWRLESFSLPKLPEGLYLLEARLGPQVAHMPLLFSSTVGFVRRTEVGLSAWFVDRKTGRGAAGIPVSVCRPSPTSGIAGSVTDADGKAEIPGRFASGWLGANLAGGFHANPLPVSLSGRIRIDRGFYRPGERIRLRGEGSGLPEALELVEAAGSGLSQGHFAIQARRGDLGFVDLPKDLAPGLYRLLGEDAASSPFESVPEGACAESCLALPEGRMVFRVNEPVRLSFRTLSREPVTEASLFFRKPDGTFELADRQERICESGRCEFAFAPARTGVHRAAAGDAEVVFFAGAGENLPHTWIERAGSKVALLLPPSGVSRWVVFSDDRGAAVETIALPASRTCRTVEFAPPAGQPAEIRTFRKGAEGVSNEVWMLPWGWGMDLLGAPEIEAESETEIAVPCGESAGCFPARFFPRQPRFFEGSAPEIAVRAHAVNSPKLYAEWARRFVLRHYLSARQSLRRGDHADALRECLELMRLSPGDESARELLPAVVEAISGEKMPDLLTLLEQQVTLPGPMNLEDFAAAISDQTGVYIELDPDLASLPEAESLFDSTPVGEPPLRSGTRARTPSGSAVSMLNYVLTQRNLAYRIEHGALFISKAGENQAGNLLDEIDRKVDALSPPLGIPKIEADRPDGSFECAPSASLRFPESGIWLAPFPGTENSAPGSAMWVLPRGD